MADGSGSFTLEQHHSQPRVLVWGLRGERRRLSGEAALVAPQNLC